MGLWLMPTAISPSSTVSYLINPCKATAKSAVQAPTCGCRCLSTQLLGHFFLLLISPLFSTGLVFLSPGLHSFGSSAAYQQPSGCHLLKSGVATLERKALLGVLAHVACVFHFDREHRHRGVGGLGGGCSYPFPSPLLVLTIDHVVSL
jgi:hypothetical protein